MWKLYPEFNFYLNVEPLPDNKLPGRTSPSGTGSTSDCPTPPPRAKHSKDHRPIKKRPTFGSLHDQLGKRIIADQEERWKRLNN